MATKKKTDKEGLIDEVLSRGVDTVYPSREALAKRLRSRRKLTLYLGVDPSSPELHIGNTVVLHKLRQFQQLGHRVILLIGDFTGQTGDPTDKQAVRQPLTKAQVRANAKSYRRQAATILDFGGRNPAVIRYNGQWLEELKFSQVAELAGHFTVQQMIERDMFENRLKAGKPISLREFLYPLMQGYDSVALSVDLEVGATDQTFNMLAGRKLAREYLGKEKLVLTTPLLVDASGKKIGKTEGNAIAILQPAEGLYGQVMALPDEVIGQALELCTSASQSEVNEVTKLATKNPRDAKMRLAFAVVREYQGAKAAEQAQRAFVKTHQHHQGVKPAAWKAPKAGLKLAEVMKLAGLVTSGSEARRKIAEGAVKVNGEAVTDPYYTVKRGRVIEFGKKKKRAIRVG